MDIEKTGVAPVTGIGAVDYTSTLDPNLEADYVYFDSINGAAGTDWMRGRRGYPVNNWADAVVIATARHTQKIQLLNGVVTVTSDQAGFSFLGNYWNDPLMSFTDNAIDLAGHTLTQCNVRGLNITDSVGGSVLDECGPFEDCAWIVVDQLTDCLTFRATYIIATTGLTTCSYFVDSFVQAPLMTGCYSFINCNLVITAMNGCYIIIGGGVSTCALAGCYNFVGVSFDNCTFVGCYGMSDCNFDDPTVFDLTGIIANCVFIGLDGEITFTNKTDANDVLVSGVGSVTVDASCTLGTINVYGDIRVVNNSGGTVVNDYTTTGGSTTILNAVNAILVTSETGGVVTTTGPGTEDNLYVNNAPAGVYEPLRLQIDMTNQTAAETTIVRVYYRIRAAGALVLQDEVAFPGVQHPELVSVALDPCRFGIQVTIERTAGAARNYDWAVVKRE